MQTVSTAWRAEQGKTLVGESFVEVTLMVTDPDALLDGSAGDNGHTDYASTHETIYEQDRTINQYATLEPNFWLLDGSRTLLPGTDMDFGSAGYVGDQVGQSDGRYALAPQLIVSFTQAHQPLIPGITIVWSAGTGEYAVDFTVAAFAGTREVSRTQVTGNGDTTSVVELDMAGYDRIVITVDKWCLPGRRARIEQVFVGIRKVFGKKDLMAFAHTEENDPLTARLPKNQIDFSVDNSAGIYNPNNPEGLTKYLMERQELSTRYGYKIGDGIEWVKGGVFYLSEWNAPQNGIKANFSARNLLEFMQADYVKGCYYPEGISLYDLAEEVLMSANLPTYASGEVRWKLDDSLRDITTTAPLPIAPIAECLQLIANAAGCIIYTTKAGDLHILPAPAQQHTDYVVGLENSYERPEITLSKPLANVEVAVYQYFTDEADYDKELFSGEIALDGGSRWVLITYSDMAVNISVDCEQMTDFIPYANACLVELSGSGTAQLVVMGDLLKTSEHTVVVGAGDKGEVQKVENPLITDTARAQAIGGWVRDCLSERRTLSTKWRSDPRLEAGDIIMSRADAGDAAIPVRVSSLKYTYNGAFRGQMKGRAV